MTLFSVNVPAAAGCVTAPADNSWQNTVISNQTGTFTAQFDATPSASPINAVVGLSNGAQTAYTGFAALARFNPSGNIDARNGAAYAAASTIPYLGGVNYHFRIVINVPSRTYSIFVTAAGGSERAVGTNYAFRSEQGTVSSLNWWGASANSSNAGSLMVCNFTIATPTPTPTPAATPTPSSNPGQPFGGTPWTLPGTVQAENFDTGGNNIGYLTSDNINHGGQYRTSEGVSIETTTDTGGGFDVGWTTAGEWLNYAVNVAASGSYTVQIRVANNGPGGIFHFNVDGATATTQLTVPNTGDWQAWQTLSTGINLSAGQHIIQLFMDRVGSAGTVGNFNWFSVGTASASTTRLIGYIPDYNGSWTGYAQSINFSKMTHLNLAFGNPPSCNGTCTSSSNMNFGLGQSDAEIATLVNTAHASGVKVLLSIGGGGGDQQIIQFYNAGLSTPLVNSLDSYIKAHNLDGVDVDIEDPGNMGQPFATFVNAVVAKFRPQGKIVSAAVAQYLQSAMPDSALRQFDFINVMTYSTYANAQNDLQFYSVQKSVPANQINLGVAFFASNSSGSIEEEYNTILAAYPNAWQSDSVCCGSLDGGQTFTYTGEASMAQQTQLGKQYGGIMLWELTGDAPAPHSLLHVIQNNL